MKFADHDWNQPYASQRAPVIAENIVATSQPLAAQAGLSMLIRGGNAVDAAIATAICLTVVEPTANGIGSDAFALVWDGKKLHGLNGSGKSPQNWNADRFANMDSMPKFGWDSITVPGAVSSWVALSARFGKLPLSDLFEPAIKYATEGFQVSPVTARAWDRAAGKLGQFRDFASCFLPNGSAPRTGERFVCKDQGNTLKEIAATGGESFYRGALAEQVIACSKQAGGMMTLDDLATHQPEWVEPLSVDYRGYQIHELPPNGQGIAALQSLAMLDRFDMTSHPVDSAESLHLQIETIKLAFADLYQQVADPAYMTQTPSSMIEANHINKLTSLIDPGLARFPGGKINPGGGTVYLTTADADGMMVSFIQSNYYGFGSGVVIPGTGIAMQNRGCGFTLEDGHPNQVAGGKRPLHTIIPAMVTRDGKPVISFGVMGGPMQPQGHVQMLVRMIDYAQNPQAACDAPRWCLLDDFSVAIEPGLKDETLNSLRQCGHTIVTDQTTHTFGGAQIICKADGCYVGASDHRKDGLAVGF